MKSYDVIQDETGERWSILYESAYVHRVDEAGEPVLLHGRRSLREVIVGVIEYKREAEPESEYRPLPRWAAPRPDLWVTLCWFDEDEQTGEIEPWPDLRDRPAEPVA